MNPLISDVVNVQGNSAQLNIEGRTVNGVRVGDNGRLVNILAPVSISNTRANGTDLRIDNSNDTGSRNVAIGSTQVRFDLGPPIGYAPGALSLLELQGGVGSVGTPNSYTISDTPAPTFVVTGGDGDTVDVQGTSAAGPTTVINAGAGRNTVNVGNTFNRLDDLRGPLTVNGQTATTTLNINDQAATASHPAVTIAAAGITGLAPAAINFTSISVSTLSILGGGGNNSYTITGTPANNSMALNTGGGTDTVNVRATTVPLAVNTTTGTGGGGNDVVNIGNAGSAQGIFRAVTIFNRTSRDQVNIDDSADNNGDRIVTISTGAVTGLAPAAINFTADVTGFPVSTLSVLGGSGNNTYTISGRPASNSVNLTAGVGNNTLIGPSGFAFWNINGNNLGQLEDGHVLVNFIGVRNLTGASGNDSFTFADGAGVAGSIDGGGGTSVLDYSAYSTPVTVNLSTNIATGVGGSVRNIGVLQGGGSNNSLTGNAAGNTLFFGSTGNDNITGLGTGNTLFIIDPNGAATTFRVTAQNSGTATTGASTTTFTGVQNLTGLSGADTYVFSDGAGVSGNIADDGVVSGSSNTLNYAAYTTTVVVDLQTHKGTGVGGSILDIQNVTGGNGGPAETYNLLIGNGGNILTGGTGRRNILVAGGAASTLNGGNQDDLLIAGFTQYDTQAGLASWLQIAAYWAGTDGYATRVDNLTRGNGVPLLDASTVTGNGGGNTLNGTGELAWIFSDGADFGNGLFDPASQFVHIDP